MVDFVAVDILTKWTANILVDEPCKLNSIQTLLDSSESNTSSCAMIWHVCVHVVLAVYLFAGLFGAVSGGHFEVVAGLQFEHRQQGDGA